LHELASESLADVARARGLAVKGDFEVDLIAQSAVRDYVRDALHEDIPADQLRLLGTIEASLGVLPLEGDPETILLDLYESGVLGIYDRERKTLLIGDFVEQAQLGRVVGHESAHGLQDMHFDLEKMQARNPGRTDSDNARVFLVEGDAEAAYLASLTSQGIAEVGDAALLASGNMALELAHVATPHATLARMMQMPYADGTRTIVALAKERGWQAIDELYAQPPETTEQMLHLDKLLEREPAVPVEIDGQALVAGLARAGANDLRLAWEDEIGEAGLLAMLADVMGAERARKAAEGWGGDRYAAILPADAPPGTIPMVVGMITWDRTREAADFEPGFRTYLEKHKPGRHLLVRRRDAIVFATHPIEGLAPEALENVLWASLRVRKGRSQR
jgi:hypothetical protein